MLEITKRGKVCNKEKRLPESMNDQDSLVLALPHIDVYDVLQYSPCFDITALKRRKDFLLKLCNRREVETFLANTHAA